MSIRKSRGRYSKGRYSKGRYSKRMKLAGMHLELIGQRIKPVETVQIISLSVEDNNQDFSYIVEQVVERVEVDEYHTNSTTNLFESNVLVERMENEPDEHIGKSFRSKELNEKDLLERTHTPTLEDQWIQGEKGEKNSGWIKRFIFVGVLLFMASGIWAFVNLDKEKFSKQERDAELEKLAFIAKKNQDIYIRDRASLNECLKGYLEATTIEERARWSRNPDDVLSKMAKHYSNELTFNSYHFDGIVESVVIDVLSKELTVVGARINSLSGEVHTGDTLKSLLLEKQKDGSYLVDWDTEVVYQPSDWSDFVKTKSIEPRVFRVEVIERIDYGPYMYAFSDDRRYQSYRVNLRTSPDQFLIAYAKIDSEVGKTMRKEFFDNKGRKNRLNQISNMTLKLAFPIKAETDQCVEIIEIVSESWFTP